MPLTFASWKKTSSMKNAKTSSTWSVAPRPPPAAQRRYNQIQPHAHTERETYPSCALQSPDIERDPSRLRLRGAVR
jgi:hypothetical protein